MCWQRISVKFIIGATNIKLLISIEEVDKIRFLKLKKKKNKVKTFEMKE